MHICCYQHTASQCFKSKVCFKAHFFKRVHTSPVFLLLCWKSTAVDFTQHPDLLKRIFWLRSSRWQSRLNPWSVFPDCTVSIALDNLWKLASLRGCDLGVKSSRWCNGWAGVHGITAPPPPQHTHTHTHTHTHPHPLELSLNQKSSEGVCVHFWQQITETGYRNTQGSPCSHCMSQIILERQRTT